MKKILLALVFIQSLFGFSIFAGMDMPLKLAIQPAPSEASYFTAKGKNNLLYELSLENFENNPMNLQSLEVDEIWPSGKVTHRKFNREELKKMYSGIAALPTQPQDPVLQAGQAGVIYVLLDYPQNLGLPKSVTNKIVGSRGAAGQKTYTMSSAPLSVAPKAATLIASPLKGENWFTPNGPSNVSIHRRVMIPMDGKVEIPERFAVDWIEVDEKGLSYKGDPKKNENYYAYKKPIYAVASGKVVAAKDGIPENTPTEKEMAVTINLETIGGNYIIQEVAPGIYAFYAHMIPGSQKVKVGDLVKEGALIGLLGNSGNSSEPHLHFQLIDQANPLHGEGLPFTLKNFIRTNYDMKLDDKQDFTYFKIKDKHPVQNESFINFDLGDL